MAFNQEQINRERSSWKLFMRNPSTVHPGGGGEELADWSQVPDRTMAVMGQEKELCEARWKERRCGARGSERTGGLNFTADPAQGRCDSKEHACGAGAWHPTLLPPSPGRSASVQIFQSPQGQSAHGSHWSCWAVFAIANEESRPGRFSGVTRFKGFPLVLRPHIFPLCDFTFALSSEMMVLAEGHCWQTKKLSAVCLPTLLKSRRQHSTGWWAPGDLLAQPSAKGRGLWVLVSRLSQLNGPFSLAKLTTLKGIPK